MKKLSISNFAPRVAFGVALFGMTFMLSACDDRNEKPAAEAAPTVIVDQVKLVDLHANETFTARVEAKDKVKIVTRVEGFLEKRNFTQGDRVKEGSTLFEIQKNTYQIAVEQAEANLATANANAVFADQTYKRMQALTNRDAASKAQLDQATANLATSKAAIQASTAQLQNAQLNLSYTTIKAPFDGRVGRAAYSVGNLVNPASGTLVELVREDPVFVTFPVPQRRYLEFVKQGAGGDSIYVELVLGDGTVYAEKGKFSFVDVEATASTDSITVRAIFPNPNGILIDKQLVQAKVVTKESYQKLVIPQAAMLIDQEGTYVLKIGEGSKVELARVELGLQTDQAIVVVSGLKEGDKVIVSGLTKARPGIMVKTEDVSAQASSNPDVVIKK